ncbi:serine hydrolase domain-containing protein [Labedaea rhizosphaerae]|uniref:D-alanyl-D-alanine carboxypeptidase n=1 Tax=Labedaea rhizosphaerae TaxID=598644 RepID=A0A4R6RZ90_LABRH|nr:serine hydrolase domain-containing protein [Labedaea rhizosphaerae]TDP92234.1 D-alanyl-D-alanine carboxypeptidase [Labedaea rhizosphaerae]
MTFTDALDRTAADHGPGLLGLITEGGRTVFEGATGVADLGSRRRMTADDLVRIGSITKTYVSVLAMQLAAEGAFAFGDTVEHWLPGLVDGGDQITMELLLRMRSGLPDYGDGPFGDERDLEPLRRYWRPEELVAAALAKDDRKPPDSVYRYCNTDYILLGLIIERATGERVDVHLHQRICVPLGLTATIFPIADPHLRGPHARGHLRVRGEWVECTTLSMSEGWTAGGMAASARDVALFFDALFDGRLLAADGLAHMTDCSEVLDDEWSRGVGLVRFRDAYGHTGGIPGYTTIAWRTATGRTIILCQNGIDLNNMLTSENPFVLEALRG